MPPKTKPVEEIIPRGAHPEIQPLLDLFSDLLEELVNFGSHVLNWDNRPQTKGEENIPPVMLLRHFLDVLDSISLLARQACGDPMKILIRGLFETKLFIQYIFEKDSFERALTYVYSDLQSQIKIMTMLNPSSIQGKDLRSTLHKEGLGSTLNTNKKYNIPNEISGLEQALLQPKFQKIHAEYLRLKQGKGKTPWYGFFSGPKTIDTLATHLKAKGQYDLLYRTWSATVHALGIYQGKLTTMAGGGVGISQLRDPRDVQMLTHYCMTFSFEVFTIYAKNRIPDKSKAVAEWYLGLRDVYMDIGQVQRIIISN